MKLSLTNSDVVTALTAYISEVMPSLAGSDIALDYTLSRGANPQLTIDVLVGPDAVQFRKEQDELAANAQPVGRRKRVEASVEEAVEPQEDEVEDEVEDEEVAVAPTKPATRFKRPAAASGE